MRRPVKLLSSFIQSISSAILHQRIHKQKQMATTMRFISAHLAPGRKFNFQRYIKRSLEDDFKLLVGISPVLWASFVIFLLFNVNGWRTLFWASIPPVIIILAVGTKLQAIMATMALEISETYPVVQGMPLVQGSDRYFWFNCPQLLLHNHFQSIDPSQQTKYSSQPEAQARDETTRPV